MPKEIVHEALIGYAFSSIFEAAGLSGLVMALINHPEHISILDIDIIAPAVILAGGRYIQNATREYCENRRQG